MADETMTVSRAEFEGVRNFVRQEIAREQESAAKAALPPSSRIDCPAGVAPAIFKEWQAANPDATGLTWADGALLLKKSELAAPNAAYGLRARGS